MHLWQSGAKYPLDANYIDVEHCASLFGRDCFGYTSNHRPRIINKHVKLAPCLLE